MANPPPPPPLSEGTATLKQIPVQNALAVVPQFEYTKGISPFGKHLTRAPFISTDSCVMKFIASRQTLCGHNNSTTLLLLLLLKLK